MAFIYTSSSENEKSYHVPTGNYDLHIIDAVETTSRNSGNTMIKLHMEVIGHGCRLFDYLIASDSFAWKVDAFRRSIGDNPKEGQKVELMPNLLVGRKARAKLITEAYGGKTRNKVDQWLEPTNTQENDNVPF
ncbi:MAG: DUF669 domain-containing protein [Opitutales bacterium]|nr:DUF669 domain-containing protein [Opitutales bacterium]